MSEINRAEILKQMGITQWVLREAVSEVEIAQESKTVSVVPPEPVAERRVPLSAGTAAPVATQIAAQSPPAPEVPPSQIISAETLNALHTEVQNCKACDLASSRTQTVFGAGPERADWLFVGEAPGQQEDRQGMPFVGRAGSLLTQMLLALGQTREQVYVANMLKCRPPGNRDPLPEELAACEPFLLRQIAFLQPKVIVALGRISAQALLKSEQSLGRLRGQIYHYGVDDIPLIVTYHPAYLLRNPADKVKVWQDLLLANRQLAG